MSNLITGEQIRDLVLRGEVRYIRFVRNRDKIVWQGTKKLEKGKPAEWQQIELPKQKGDVRNTIKVNDWQIIDLQEY